MFNFLQWSDDFSYWPILKKKKKNYHGLWLTCRCQIWFSGFSGTPLQLLNKIKESPTPRQAATAADVVLFCISKTLRCSTRTFLKGAPKNRKRIASQCVWIAPSSSDKFAMSAKLNALNSDSYTDVSQYRDQHFKVSTSNLYTVIPCSKNPSTLFVIVPLLCFFRSTTVSNRQSLHFARFMSVGIHSFHFNILLWIT